MLVGWWDGSGVGGAGERGVNSIESVPEHCPFSLLETF